MTEPGARTVPATLDALLTERAREDPDRAALQLPRGTGFRATSYAALEARVDAVAAGLSQAGFRPGLRTALLVPPTEDFFVLSFALLRLRAVPVLVDPGIGRDKVKGCLNEAAPRAFIGVARAHLARRVLGWAPSAELLVSVARVAPPAGRTLRDVEQVGRRLLPFTPQAGQAGDSPAAILFTSGSTGPPKGVEYGQQQLLAQAALIRQLYGLGPAEVSLSTFPPFALFGPVLGMTTVIPRMDATRPADVKPARVVRAARRFGATVMFGSPALLDTVSRAGGSMPSIRQVISAGAPVPRVVQHRTLAMLEPGAQLHTPYGATEALPVTTISSSELLDLPVGICVGSPVPGVDVALIRISDSPFERLTPDLLVADGEVGEVVVRGPVVSTRYADRPDATAAAKLDWDGRVAHRMGDLASRDEAGRLWFAGRKSHVVNTVLGPLFSVPCEEVFNVHPAVRRSALVGTGPRDASTPVLCVELEPGVSPSPALTAELLDLGAADERTVRIRTVRYHPGFPVDIRHNSKIDRPALADWVGSRP